MPSSPQIFYADAVLFDVDGTLTDSTTALEAAWGRFAQEVGEDRQYIIDATRGKRCADSVAHFKPYVKEHEIDGEVTKFEESVLFFSDAYKLYGPGSKLRVLSDSGDIQVHDGETTQKFQQESHIRDVADNKELDEWQLEAASVDRAIQILPGVKRLIDSIPAGRYAVATSATKIFAYGSLNRVGITPPAVTITADDKRVKAGKPAPDTFLLAAECLGYDPKKCVVFEDSPAGIFSGVASGATVIAVCTSHERSKIENYGAHYVIENMNYVTCEVKGGRLKFTILYRRVWYQPSVVRYAYVSQIS